MGGWDRGFEGSGFLGRRTIIYPKGIKEGLDTVYSIQVLATELAKLLVNLINRKFGRTNILHHCSVAKLEKATSRHHYVTESIERGSKFQKQIYKLLHASRFDGFC